MSSPRQRLHRRGHAPSRGRAVARRGTGQPQAGAQEGVRRRRGVSPRGRRAAASAPALGARHQPLRVARRGRKAPGVAQLGGGVAEGAQQARAAARRPTAPAAAGPAAAGAAAADTAPGRAALQQPHQAAAPPGGEHRRAGRVVDAAAGRGGCRASRQHAQRSASVARSGRLRRAHRPVTRAQPAKTSLPPRQRPHAAPGPRLRRHGWVAQATRGAAGSGWVGRGVRPAARKIARPRPDEKRGEKDEDTARRNGQQKGREEAREVKRREETANVTLCRTTRARRHQRRRARGGGDRKVTAQQRASTASPRLWEEPTKQALRPRTATARRKTSVASSPSLTAALVAADATRQRRLCSSNRLRAIVSRGNERSEAASLERHAGRGAVVR